MKNITAYLIEEASAEEEELLGQNEPTEEADEKDSIVFKVLELVSFYIDFLELSYSTCLFLGVGSYGIIFTFRTFGRLLQPLRVPKRRRNAQQMRYNPRQSNVHYE